MFEHLNLDIAERVNLRKLTELITERLRHHPAFSGEQVDVGVVHWTSQLYTVGYYVKEQEIVIVHPEVSHSRDERFMTPWEFARLASSGDFVPENRDKGVFVVRVWPEYSREESYSLSYSGSDCTPVEEKLGALGPERIYMRLFCAFKKEGS